MSYLLNALHFKKYLRSSSQYRCTVERNRWRDSIGGSKIKTLKMLGALGGLFLVFFYLFVTLKIKSGRKKVSLHSKEVKMLEA